MGMFDSVFADCLGCGSRIEFQSKAGGCDLRRYKADNVPAEIAVDLSNEYYAPKESCPICKRVFQLKAVVPRVHMVLREVGTDDEWD